MINQNETFYEEKKRRRNEQFKFFGVKGFVSVYAKKPHIKIKAAGYASDYIDVFRGTSRQAQGNVARRGSPFSQLVANSLAAQQAGMGQSMVMGMGLGQQQLGMNSAMGVRVGQSSLSSIFGANF